jgi:hypothetical protein
MVSCAALLHIWSYNTILVKCNLFIAHMLLLLLLIITLLVFDCTTTEGIITKKSMHSDTV